MPSDFARGPFEGLQGGATAALMCAAIASETAGFVTSATTHFLKPVPMTPLSVNVRPLRLGRRVSIVDAELSSGDSVVAVQRATLILPGDGENLPTPPSQPERPEDHPVETRRAAHGRPWLFDSMEVRRNCAGVVWFRQRVPIIETVCAMAQILPAADWAHGLGPPLGALVRPNVAIPNPDLAVHLFRPPRGEWIGVEHSSAWSSEAIGTGWGALRDTEGLIGRVAMSVAVALLEDPASQGR